MQVAAAGTPSGIEHAIAWGLWVALLTTALALTVAAGGADGLLRTYALLLVSSLVPLHRSCPSLASRQTARGATSSTSFSSLNGHDFGVGHKGFLELDNEVTWTADGQSSADGGDAGDQHPTPPNPVTSNNDPRAVPPSSPSTIYTAPRIPVTGEETVGACDLPDDEGAYVTVQGSWGAEATGCVDNAIVTDDKMALSFTMTTSIN